MGTAISESAPEKVDWKAVHEAEKKEGIKEAKRLSDQHVKEPAAMIWEQDNRVSHVMSASVTRLTID
jgi:hypothetical protein